MSCLWCESKRASKERGSRRAPIIAVTLGTPMELMRFPGSNDSAGRQKSHQTLRDFQKGQKIPMKKKKIGTKNVRNETNQLSDGLRETTVVESNIASLSC